MDQETTLLGSPQSTACTITAEYSVASLPYNIIVGLLQFGEGHSEAIQFHMKRRSYLTTASVVAAAAVAGCTGGGDDADNETADGDDGDDGFDDGIGGDDNGGDDQSDLLGTFDDFEELDAWEPVVGSVESDDGRVYEGSQSARLLATESETQVRIVRELSDPIDVSEAVPGLALSTDGGANPVIQLHDADGDILEYQQHTREGQPFVRHNFGLTSVDGDPDPSEITEIQLISWVGEEAEEELWVDDLHFVSRINTGRVMVQFQGGYATDYTGAFPIMDEHDLTGTTFVATDRVRESEEADGNRMTEAQLDELVDAGWSVGTVGARGQQLHQVEPDRVESDILDPLEWFDEHGYDDAAYFAFPGGRYDEEMYDLVSENYDLGFAGRYQSQGWASNPYNLTRISADGDQRNLDGEQLTNIVDWAAAHGGLTSIVFYEMDDGDVSALETLAARLAEHQSAGDLELITPEEIATEYVD